MPEIIIAYNKIKTFNGETAVIFSLAVHYACTGLKSGEMKIEKTLAMSLE